MTDGYRTLREDSGRIDLSSRGLIKVTGEDRARLLHAMTTNHVQGLVPGAGCYAFFLSAQGRVLADAVILCFEEYLLLETEPETRGFIVEHLDKFIIADDVTLEDVTGSMVNLGIEGPAAEAAMQAAGLPVPEAPFAHRASGELIVVRATTTGAPGFRILSPMGFEMPFAEMVATSGDDVNVVRHEWFFPRYGEDITNANLPQEAGIADALHFNKGCYLGQEIVERVRSRGHVNRMLMGLRIEGQAEVKRGTKVLFEDAEAGEITSAAYSPALEATMAMGYLRVNAAKVGTAVRVDGRAAQTTAIKSSRT
jgi:tRNA-modifying protein YgfZ